MIINRQKLVEKQRDMRLKNGKGTPVAAPEYASESAPIPATGNVSPGLGGRQTDFGFPGSQCEFNWSTPALPEVKPIRQHDQPSFPSGPVAEQGPVKRIIPRLTKEHYLPMEAAREFVSGVGLQGFNEWLDYCQSGRKPLNIPTAPYNVYGAAFTGAGGMGWWLGTNAVRPKKIVWRSVNEARIFMVKRHLRNRYELSLYCEFGEKPDDIPEEPYSAYGRGFKGMDWWLGYNIKWTNEALLIVLKFVKQQWPGLSNKARLALLKRTSADQAAMLVFGCQNDQDIFERLETISVEAIEVAVNDKVPKPQSPKVTSPDKLPPTRIEAADLTIETLPPGAQAYTSLTAFYAVEDNQLMGLKTSIVRSMPGVDIVHKPCLIGRDSNGNLWIDISRYPKHVFKRSGLATEPGEIVYRIIL